MTGAGGFSTATDRIVAVGHRVVHGGLRYTIPTLVDDHVLADLEEFNPLAPLHQPHNLAAIRVLRKRSPDLPQVACFDTSFHTSIPAVGQAFALPRKFTEQGVRRYGFHGLSYEYISSVLPGVDPEAAKGRTIVAHLGNGASLCAMQGLKSTACTLGFTAVEGLMMGTRCGTLDPGVMLYLMDECGMDARAIEKLIYKESGLLGVSGISSDMRTLLESRDPRPPKRWNSSSTGSAGKSDRSPPHSGGSMRLFSPGGSERTPSRSASGSAVPRSGWAWNSTKRPMQGEGPGSAGTGAGCGPG